MNRTPLSVAKRQAKARIRARARQCGAALVEMVVVVPAFVILFAGMLFLHHVIAKTQRTQLAARNQAWTEAMASCSGGGTPVTQPDFTSDMTGAPGSSVSLTATPGEANGSADDTASVAILAAGPSAVAASNDVAFFQSVHSKAIVMCNTTTQAGNIPGVFKWFMKPSDFTLIFGGP
jgi:hypothetical protein